MYWLHISRDGTPFIQFKAKDNKLLLVLRYFHAILAYTITYRSDSQAVVTCTNTGIPSHHFRGILVDFTYIFFRQARDNVSTTRKKSLDLRLFITRVTTYFRIDKSTLWRCSDTMIPFDHTILQSMQMICIVGDHYIVRDALPEDPPTPDDELPEDILPPSLLVC